MTRFALLSAAAAMAVVASPALAQSSKHASGVSNGIPWEARSLIVGMTSTATAALGGDPIYFANAPKYNGTVTLIMEYASGAFICTGSAISATHILSAAHCVSDGFGTANPLRTRAYFTDSADPDLIRFGAGFNPVAGVTAIDVSTYHVNPGYTGQVIDQNDIVILELAEAIPGYAEIYDLFLSPGLTGQQFNVVGNGARSNVGGAIGANQGTGVMRQGENIFDFAWGDAGFGGFFTDGDFWGTADYQLSYVSDFDSGLAANDVGGGLDGFFPTNFAQLGVGALEVSVAGGDSGGPSFIDGKVAAVTSYGAKFGVPDTDVDGPLNSSWGEMNGFVPVYIHGNWIASIIDPQAVIPEPATWAMMIGGFGLVGFAARRRRATDMAKVAG